MLPRSYATAGEIVLPDAPQPDRLELPRVLVAGASESGPRYAITRELAGNAEDSAPTLRRRPGSRPL
jgi:hypothetical protein